MHGPAGGCRTSRRPLRGLLRHCEPTGRAYARPMTGSATQSIVPRKRRDGLLRRFAPRNDGLDTTSHSRGMICPKLCMNIVPPNMEGAGNAGYALHPRSRVPICAKRAHTSIQVQRRHSGIPCAMALRLTPRSPRRRIRLVTVIGGLAAVRTRSGPQNLRRLDTSDGCQDHTASRNRRSSCALPKAHGAEPALPSIRAPALPRPPHSMPNVRDDRDTPLVAGRNGGVLTTESGVRYRYIFLRERLDRWNRFDCVEEIRVSRLTLSSRSPRAAVL
jgi:hypothetical protein